MTYIAQTNMIQQTQPNGFAPARYWLRWRFEYDHKSPRLGMWNRQSDIESDQAWCQPRVGLSRVMIEAKDMVTKDIKVVIDCPAAEYRNLQWISCHHVKSGITYNVGLQMLTRYWRLKVFGIGQVEQEALTQEEMDFHFKTYGS